MCKKKSNITEIIDLFFLEQNTPIKSTVDLFHKTDKTKNTDQTKGELIVRRCIIITE